MDLEIDWRLFSYHAGQILRRRSGRPPSKRAIQRLEKAETGDPHAAWKRRRANGSTSCGRLKAFADQR
jgi:hypothetical protein